MKQSPPPRARTEVQLPEAELVAKADLLAERARTTDAGRSKQALTELAQTLYKLRRYSEALDWLDQAWSGQAKAFQPTNLRGILLRRLGRLDEAIQCFRAAAKLDPRGTSALINAGHAYLDKADAPQAIEMLLRAVRLEPKSAETQRMLGKAYRIARDGPRARQRFELARQLAPGDPVTWSDFAETLDWVGDTAGALECLDRGVRRLGPAEKLIKVRITIMRRLGQFAEAAAWLEPLIAQYPDRADLHHQHGLALVPMDKPRAIASLTTANRLAPNDEKIIVDLAEHLSRMRGGDEARAIAAAHDLALRRLAMPAALLPDARALWNILIRCADYENLQRIPPLETLGPYWAKTEQESGLHGIMPRVETAGQRRLLVDYHRTWGRIVTQHAATTPLNRPSTPPANRARIKIGFMSSDLRSHPVAYFAGPVIRSLDRDRFEVFCYSWWAGPTDEVQEQFASQADVFRLTPDASNRGAAQIIADDQLDVLFELGGSTEQNKVRAMAWRPAPRQASWLGYPHSAGIEAIDRIVTDPYITPADPALLIERPLELPRSWVAFDQPGFDAPPEIDPQAASERTGMVTFGTMNNPSKYSSCVIATWARVLMATPGSRFLFVRPEGGVPIFRNNIEREFQKHGVDPGRIIYKPVRGAHLPYYNAIDVSLDTFPQTGGTTTCEALFMGVPVVSLVGEAFFERLSFSNLSNAGLGELCVPTLDDYVAKAVETAGRVEWRGELRRTMRERLKSHPLGRTGDFVTGFETAVQSWMEEAPR